MAHSLPLDKMSIEEKLQMMEALWEDLSRNAPSLAAPQWHGDILAERKVAASRGDDQISDWKEVRERIEKEIR